MTDWQGILVLLNLPYPPGVILFVVLLSVFYHSLMFWKSDD